MFQKMFAFFLATAAAVASSAFSGLSVDVSKTRSQSEIAMIADHAVRLLNRNFVILSRKSAKRKFLTLPLTVRLMQNGSPLPPPANRGRGPELNLIFESSGARAFPPEYRTLLQAVYARAKPVMDAVFGEPSVGGDVKVANYDGDIGDRDALAGGYFLPNNGAGFQEIRFPVYEDQVGIKAEVAAVNFIHCLLLAYLGPNGYFADAFNEGFVRAATIRVVRTPNALPADTDPVAAEQVLESTYDVGAFYDWWSDSALACRHFIAPNLRNQSLPVGGSTGGVYLLRYQMSGSAWLKLLIEHPGFLAEMNRLYYANPPAFGDSQKLVALAQQALNTLSGSSNVEGIPFAKWFEKQHILRVENVAGKKLMQQSFPIESGLGGDDYGVFGIQTHWFESKPNGDEMLLDGTSYPMYWTPRFTRISATAQDDVIGIQLGYGSVVPNFTNSFDNAPYRVTVDAPVSDQIARSYLPAGAVATPSSVVPSNFYGCLIGGQDGSSYSVSLSWTGGGAGPIPITNAAFGQTIGDVQFENAMPLTITVKRGTGASATTVLTRKINKSVGPLAVYLYLDATESFSVSAPKGISLQGFGFAPYRQDLRDIFGTDLGARYDPAKGRYDIYPDCGALAIGNGFFVRPDQAMATTIAGLATKNTPVAVALKPGWNLISNPLQTSVNLSNILVIKTTDTPVAYADAIGTLVGTDLFGFTRGANDPISGVPEGGSFSAISTLSAGQAFLVRVLEPNGVSLLFNSSSASSPGRSASDPSASWSVKITTDGGDEKCDAWISQSRSATAGYDVKEDSPLPPRIGGMQAVLGQNLYRDVRRLGTNVSYSMRIENIRPGKKYKVRVEAGVGKFPKLTLYDAKVRMKRTYTRPALYSFTSDTTTRTIEFTVSK